VAVLGLLVRLALAIAAGTLVFNLTACAAGAAARRHRGHMSLLFSRRVYELLRENLAAGVEPARHIS